MSYNTNQDSNKPPLAVIIIILLVGILLTGFGISRRMETQRKSEYYLSTTGYVVKYNTGSKKSTYAPVYEYQVDGTTYTYSESVYTAGKKEIGKSVTIRYNPDDPYDAYAEVTADTAFLFLAIGVFFSTVGITLLLQSIEIFTTRTTDLITGILFACVFIGFPIALLKAIPGLNLFPKLILLALMVGGVGILIGAFYSARIKTPDGKSYEERKKEAADRHNEKLEEFYNSDFYRSVDESREKVHKIKPIAVGLLVVFLLIQAFILPSKIRRTLDSQKNQPVLKTNINDQLVADYCSVSKHDVPKYIVYKCVIADRQDDVYFIEEVAGIPYCAVSNEDFEIGESVYWVEISGGRRILLDMDTYVYNGNNIPNKSDRYYIDNRCIIDYYFLQDYCGGEASFITEVSFTEKKDNEYFFEDKKHNVYSEIIPDEYIRYYSDIEEDDEYYYVVVNNVGYLFSKDLYICLK